MKTVLIIIAQRGFQDYEYSETRNKLESADVKIVVASVSKGICYGTFGSTVKPNLSLDEVNISDFNAIVFIGGEGMSAVRQSSDATRIVSEAHKSGKVIGAICWAPTILAKSGILQGKKATVWLGYDDEFKLTTDKYLEQRGAHFTAESITVDGKIITANGPAAAKMFGDMLSKLLD